MRFDDKELLLIKSTFAENDGLLKQIRKHFLQEETSKEVMGLSKDAKAVLRKAFLPTIDTDAPIHQVVDLWLTLDLKEKSPEQLQEHAFVRQKLIKYLDDRLTVLEGKKVKDEIDFNTLNIIDGKSALDVFINLNVRSILLMHVEQQLSQLEILGGTKEETPEQMKKRLLQDSAK